MFCCTGIFLTRMMELKIPQWWTVPWYVLHISRSHVHSLVSLGFKVPSPETSESAKQEVIKSPTCDKQDQLGEVVFTVTNVRYVLYCR